jgi:hypothetical protein
MTSTTSRLTLVAGSAPKLGLAASAALATTNADPIFAAIEAHRALDEKHGEACDRQALLEQWIPTDKQRTNGTHDIVPTDDPRWIAHMREIEEIMDAKFERGWALIKIEPTTLAGVVAMLRYASEFEALGNEWPDPPKGNMKFSRPWSMFLYRQLAAAIEQITA